MKHHVSSGTELMDTLYAEKCKACCISNSVGFFSAKFLFLRTWSFLFISNFKVSPLYDLCFFIAVDRTRSLFPHYYQEAISYDNLSEGCLLNFNSYVNNIKIFLLFFQFRCRQWYIIRTKSLGPHDKPWLRANSSGKFCPQST